MLFGWGIGAILATVAWKITGSPWHLWVDLLVLSSTVWFLELADDFPYAWRSLRPRVVCLSAWFYIVLNVGFVGAAAALVSLWAL